MKPVICLFVTALTTIAPLHASNTFRPITHKIAFENQGPKLRVLLAEECNSALIEAKGQYRVVNKADGTILSRGGAGKRYVMHALTKGLRWGEEYPDIYQITIKPMTKESSILVNGIQYKGAVTISHATKNRITVVNEIAIEELLTSILSVKYDVPLAEEARAAVTILERTALYAIHASQKQALLFDCTKDDLAYEGYGVTKQFMGIEEAVEGTRFMVLENSKAGKGNPSLTEIEELAHKGLDAKQILSSYYPGAAMGLTTKIPSKIMR